MAQTTPSVPSSLNPGASEYVPLSLQEKGDTTGTSPQVEEELLPPIDSVPRDVSFVLFFSFERRGRKKKPCRVSENRIFESCPPPPVSKRLFLASASTFACRSDEAM